MAVSWTKRAEQDRDVIIERIAQDNPQAAIELDDHIEHLTMASLAAHPEAFRTGRKKGTREMVLHPHYVLIYRVKGRAVTVLRLLHTSRQWP